MGSDVKLVVFEDNVEYIELLKGIDYKVFNLLNSVSIRNSNTSNMEAFKKYVSEFSPDIVHTHLFAAELNDSPMLIVPLQLEITNSASLTFYINTSYKKRFVFLCNLRSTILMTTSSAGKSFKHTWTILAWQTTSLCLA